MIVSMARSMRRDGRWRHDCGRSLKATERLFVDF
jgi:hypothetical protein